ncbi:MAG: hypothetical protein M1828_001943 [Chrysothrix sp. TS-e1954]|nr:MAG: hypothetical protein M1828_001943 [Chrysothrix sp. TS-e1954]
MPLPVSSRSASVFKKPDIASRDPTTATNGQENGSRNNPIKSSYSPSKSGATANPESISSLSYLSEGQSQTQSSTQGSSAQRAPKTNTYQPNNRRDVTTPRTSVVSSPRSSSVSASRRVSKASAAALNEDAGAHNRGASLSNGNTILDAPKPLPSRTRSVGHKTTRSSDYGESSSRTVSTSSTAGNAMGPPSSFRTPSLKTRNVTTPTSTPNPSAATSRRSSSASRPPSTTATAEAPSSTPTRRTSTSHPHVKAARPTFSTHKPRTPSRDPPAPPQTYPAHPHQPTLLQLTILHEAAGPCLASYIASSRTSLHRRFLALQETYRSYLELARQERQARNLLSLTRWCGGNRVALVRKLGVLCEIAGEVGALTAEEGSLQQDQGIERHGIEEAEVGLYTSVIRRCELWMLFVLEIWDSRDREASPNSNQPPVLDAPTTQHREHEHEHTPIEPLGPALKSDIKSLTTTLARLSTRMADLTTPSPPSIPQPPASSTLTPAEHKHHAQQSEQEAQREQSEQASQQWQEPHQTQNQNQTQAEEEEPTPKRLTTLFATSLAQMQEQLQVMREVEFEVLVGEKAWVASRVRELGGGEVGTPGR